MAKLSEMNPQPGDVFQTADKQSVAIILSDGICHWTHLHGRNINCTVDEQAATDWIPLTPAFVPQLLDIDYLEARQPVWVEQPDGGVLPGKSFTDGCDTIVEWRNKYGVYHATDKNRDNIPAIYSAQPLPTNFPTREKSEREKLEEKLDAITDGYTNDKAAKELVTITINKVKAILADAALLGGAEQ